MQRFEIAETQGFRFHQYSGLSGIISFRGVIPKTNKTSESVITSAGASLPKFLKI